MLCPRARIGRIFIESLDSLVRRLIIQLRSIGGMLGLIRRIIRSRIINELCQLFSMHGLTKGLDVEYGYEYKYQLCI